MNASDDRENDDNKQSAGSNPASVSLNHEGNATNNKNDCSKHGSIDQSSGNDVGYGGAKPKTGEIFRNIPKYVQRRSISPKLCNIGLARDGSEPSSSGLASLNIISSCNGSVLELDLQNNVDKQAVEKYSPPKVPGCSHEENRSPPTQESPASRLAAVCAASCRRAAAERARRLELGSAGRIPSRPPVDSDSSSDTGNDEGLSGDEECCIYTYKGDQNADLPNSLFGLSLPAGNDQAGPSNANNDRGSSPEMDYLEMDFDPDPSGEQDSVDEESEHGDLLNRPDSQIATPPPENDGAPNDLSACAPNAHVCSNESIETQPSPSELDNCDRANVQRHNLPHSSSKVGDTSVNTSSSFTSNTNLRKANNCWPTRDAWGHHSSGGDLCSPGDNSGEVDGESWADVFALRNAGQMGLQGEAFLDSRKFNLHSALYHCIMAKRLVLDKQADFDEEELVGACSSSGDGEPALERTMIWTEQEACSKQVSQISVSACGASAVINVLLALSIPFSLDRVKEGIATRLRAETASLVSYLFSRSIAGAAHNDLIRGLEVASEGAVYSRFFHMYPERAISLSRWLAFWMKKGAVPIAILNLQNGVAPGNQIPDSWHHQMIFGVSHRGIYLTNPLECVSEAVLWPQLCSPSVLLVKRNDIVSRWTPSTDLCRLTTSLDIRWKEMNVLGQVVNVIRESNKQSQFQPGVSPTLTSHVSIPASYCSGILLAVLKDSQVAAELKNAPELPFQDT